MNITIRAYQVLLLASLSHASFAEGGTYGSFDNVTSGSASATAGTNIYNSLNKDKPLPIHGGDDAVIRGTLYNMGAGNSAKESWRKAAEKEANVPKHRPSSGQNQR